MFLGKQGCPWGCNCAEGNGFFRMYDEKKPYRGVYEQDAIVAGSDLNAHLIKEHGFFQGKESGYRTDPEELIKALGLDKE